MNQYVSTIEMCFNGCVVCRRVEHWNLVVLWSMCKEYIKAKARRELGSFGRFVVRRPTLQPWRMEVVESWVYCYRPACGVFVFRKAYDAEKTFGLGVRLLI